MDDTADPAIREIVDVTAQGTKRGGYLAGTFILIAIGSLPLLAMLGVVPAESVPTGMMGLFGMSMLAIGVFMLVLQHRAFPRRTLILTDDGMEITGPAAATATWDELAAVRVVTWVSKSKSLWRTRRVALEWVEAPPSGRRRGDAGTYRLQLGEGRGLANQVDAALRRVECPVYGGIAERLAHEVE